MIVVVVVVWLTGTVMAGDSAVCHQCHPPVVSPAGFAQVVRHQHLRDQGGFAGEHGLPVALPSGMMMMMVTRTRRMQRLQIAWGPGRAMH